MSYCALCGKPPHGGKCNPKDKEVFKSQKETREQSSEIKKSKTQKQVDRENSKKWKENNPEKYRGYMREYMRKRRNGEI